MRIVKEYQHLPFKVTVFVWNNKYLIKAEKGMMEQTYKIAEWDLTSVEDLDEIWTEKFIGRISERFDEMKKDLRMVLDNY